MKKELVKLCVDTVNNRVQNFSAHQADEAIRKAFFEILGTDKPSYKEMRRHGIQVFEIIEEVLSQTIINGVNENDFFIQFAEVRNLASGDTVEFYVEDNSMLVASELTNSGWDISRQKLDVGQSFPVKTRAFGLAVYTDFLTFLAGRVDFASLVAKVAKAMNELISQQVATSFYAASAYLPSEFKATGTYSEEALMDVVAHVEASTGSTPVIVGTRKALSKIIGAVPAGNYSENMKNKMYTDGALEYINGVPMVQLPVVHKANTFDFAYDDNKLLILPLTDNKPIKLVFEGESMVKEVSDGTSNMDMSLEYKFITKLGTAVVFSTLYGEYSLS